MREIELKKIKGGDGRVYDYKDLILTIARTHPRGITIADMEKAVRVVGCAQAADETLLLEDADWEVLKAYVQDYPFLVAAPELLQFWKDISEAPEIEIQKEKST